MSAEKPSLSDLRIDDTSRSTGASRAVVPVAVGLLVVAALTGAWYGLGRSKPVVVQVATVEEQRAGAGSGPDTVLNASGYVTARRRATVSSKVTGKVVGVYVEEGMAVKVGQVLARLDDTTAQRYLQVADAELASAKRQAAETEVRLHEANLTLTRARSLVKEGISGQADLDAAQATVDAYKARLDLTREQVAVSAAQVALRKTELDDMVIRAPFSGVAVTKDAQPGEMISPVSAGGGFTRTGICTVVDMSSLEIEVDVNEAFIGRVSTAQKVEAVLDAYPDWRIPAHVITAVPTADRQKATVLVRIGFEALDPRILPDMGVKVSFLGPERPATAVVDQGPRLSVPKAAVRTDAGHDVVFVVKDGHLERRAVRIGTAGAKGDTLTIAGGLSAGEQVVVSGPPDLADKQKVRLQ
jgi:HlyD family secretion protein